MRFLERLLPLILAHQFFGLRREPLGPPIREHAIKWSPAKGSAREQRDDDDRDDADAPKLRLSLCIKFAGDRVHRVFSNVRMPDHSTTLYEPSREVSFQLD